MQIMSRLVRFDWAVKHLLRNKANFDVLEGFLSELLKTDIIIEEVIESEGNKNHAKDKYNRVDLVAKTSEKERIIIEVQCSRQLDYLNRVLYGTSKLVVEQLKEGAPYKDIRKVISVSIVYFNLGDEGKDYIYRGTANILGIHEGDPLLLNPEEIASYGPKIKTPADVFPEYYFIKVNSFRKAVKDKLDEWVYFFKNAKIEPSFKAKGIQVAAKKLDVLRLSEAERIAYERYQDDLHHEASMIMSHYGRGLEEGKQVGLEEGKQVGLEEGKQAGEKMGLENSLLFLLQQKFKHVPDQYHQKIRHADPGMLKQLLERVLICQTLDETFSIG